MKALNSIINYLGSLEDVISFSYKIPQNCENDVNFLLNDVKRQIVSKRKKICTYIQNNINKNTSKTSLQKNKNKNKNIY